MQIAQTTHYQKGASKDDILQWVLEVLWSDTSEDTRFALVTSLGTCLKGVGGDEAGGDCIMLAGHDGVLL